jgi:hypothetical protein
LRFVKREKGGCWRFFERGGITEHKSGLDIPAGKQAFRRCIQALGVIEDFLNKLLSDGNAEGVAAVDRLHEIDSALLH